MSELRSRAELAVFMRRMAWLGAAILALLVVGTGGFVLFEDTSVGYGFVWTLDTISTLGSIADPHSTPAHVLKSALTILGVGTLFYALVTLTEFFVAGHLSGLLADRRTQKMIDALTDHYVICGFGRVGRQVARDLRAANARYVVIDHDPANRELAEGVGVRFLEGQPADDEVLRHAGVERARGIVACVDSDAENIFITLTARELCPDVLIVARASVEDSEKKLLRAGADRVISPYKASGSEMARLALHPQIAGAVDVDAEYRMEEIGVSERCEGAGRTVGDIRGGSVIVALRKADGSLEPQPPAEAVLEPGDKFMALGSPRTLERLERLFQPDRAPAG
jgi:voltage-gated potassium channel